MIKKSIYGINMFKIILFVELFLSLTCKQSKAEDAKSVVGQIENTICGAVLVAPRVVIASAFCLQTPGVRLGNGIRFRLGSQSVLVEKTSTPSNWENVYILNPLLNYEGSRYVGLTVLRLASPIYIPVYPKLWFGQFDLEGEALATMVRLRSGVYTLKNIKMGSSGVPSAIITYPAAVLSSGDDRTNPLLTVKNGELYLLGFLENEHFANGYSEPKMNTYTGLAHIPTRRFILDNPIISDLAPFNIAPPEYFSIHKTSNTALQLNWQDRSGNETGFQIFRSTSPLSSGTLLTQVSANVTSFTDSSVMTDIQYCYQVRSVLGSSLSLPLESICAITRSSLWRNPTNKFDVNRDGFVSSLDSLVIINEMQRNGSYLLNPSGPTATSYYYDVDGDGWVTPTDTLQVINELNRR